MQNIVPELLAGLKDEPPCLVSDVQGMTAPKNRLLLNRLVKALPQDEAYLEIGTHMGATFISALIGNKDKTAYACDDFSGFNHNNPRLHFEANWKKYEAELPPLHFFNENCWDLAKKDRPFAKPIGVYFFDGDHSLESQFRAIAEYARFLAHESIVIIDDWNWTQVREGSWNAIAKLAAKELYFKEILDAESSKPVGFWNGIGIFHITK